MSRRNGAGKDVILDAWKDWPLWIAAYTDEARGLGVLQYADPGTTLLPTPPDPHALQLTKALTFGTPVTYGLVCPRVWDFGSDKWITPLVGASVASSTDPATLAGSEGDRDDRILNTDEPNDLKLMEDALTRYGMPARRVFIETTKYEVMQIV